MPTIWPWLSLALLGAYHGLNPAMGWLFAVALGLQERRRGAVLRAFVPIALGHAAAVALVVVLVTLAQTVVAPDIVRLAGAAVLIGYGGYTLLRGAVHPRWVAMRVGFRDLTLWSFLMSSAHGAGLMLLPILLGWNAATGAQAAHAQTDHAQHAAHAEQLQTMGVVAAPIGELGAVVIHTLAMFLVMAFVALVVYELVGLAILRRAWLNLDRVWAVALIAAGIVSLIVTQ
jgi:hypothetical protein